MQVCESEEAFDWIAKGRITTHRSPIERFATYGATPIADKQMGDNVMPKKEKRRIFANKAEWLGANEEAIGERFERTLAEGYSGPCNLIVTGDSTLTKIRLGPQDSSRAKEQAAERGLRYQTYLKMIIHEALRAAESSRRSA